jgi:hypothetical protein
MDQRTDLRSRPERFSIGMPQKTYHCMSEIHFNGRIITANRKTWGRSPRFPWESMSRGKPGDVHHVSFCAGPPPPWQMSEKPVYGNLPRLSGIGSAEACEYADHLTVSDG